MLSASKSGSPASTGYNLTRSLRFRASASAYLSRTPASAGNRQTWTWSGWVKRGAQGTSQGIFAASTSGSALAELYFNTSNALSFYDYTGAYNLQLVTTQVFRDSSAWYHIVVALDTTNATAANRVKIYVNGVQVTALSTATYPSQNYQGYVNNNIAHYTSSYNGSTDLYDGYLAEVNFIDGQALTPSSFGSTNALTGVWQPARYTGTYGTNGTFLEFKDNSALTTSSNVGLGKDTSGNGNYWTTNNISITAGVTYDSMTDVPTLTSATAANFAVMNAVTPNGFTLTNGNLSVFKPNVGAQTYNSRSTIAVNSGKWYVEYTVVGGISGVGAPMLGITNPANSANSSLVSFSNTFLYYGYNGYIYNNGAGAAYGATYGANDVIGMALDLNAGTLTFYKNNVSQGVATSSIAGQTFIMLVNDDQGLNSWTVAVNYGQQPFQYTPPTGFVALNTYNLPTSTIVQGNKVMDATLYTGNGGTLAVTNAAGFKPDLVWAKTRVAVSSHGLFDSVRGVNKILYSNGTAAEANYGTYGVSAFNSNGFTAVDDASGDYNVNGGSGGTYSGTPPNYVAWQWQAGQGTTSSNTNGTITSTVSVNASAGFSVVTYTGTGSGTPTIGHGLGVTPALIIGKNRSGSAQNWQVWHTSIGDNVLQLNLTNAQVASTANSVFIVAGINSSVFQVGTNPSLNGSATTQVAYCWTPIAGFSAFGSYSGNNSTDGPMVYTGFQPKFVLIKGTGNASGWQLQDSARNTYNVVNAVLRPDLSAAESTGYGGVLDFLSNGFKLRTTDTNYNSSSYGPYIYMAFATNPFKNSLGF